MSGDLSPRHQPEAQARHRLPLAGLRLHRQASTHSVDARPRILKVGGYLHGKQMPSHIWQLITHIHILFISIVVTKFPKSTYLSAHKQ